MVSRSFQGRRPAVAGGSRSTHGRSGGRGQGAPIFRGTAGKTFYWERGVRTPEKKRVCSQKPEPDGQRTRKRSSPKVSTAPGTSGPLTEKDPDLVKGNKVSLTCGERGDTRVQHQVAPGLGVRTSAAQGEQESVGGKNRKKKTGDLNQTRGGEEERSWRLTKSRTPA